METGKLFYEDPDQLYDFLARATVSPMIQITLIPNVFVQSLQKYSSMAHMRMGR